MGDRKPGPAEERCRAWVASLGDIPEWRQLLAQSAIALSALIDVEIDPSKAASASRELRQLVGLLAPTASVPVNMPERPESWSPPADPVGNVIAMVQTKQRQVAG